MYYIVVPISDDVFGASELRDHLVFLRKKGPNGVFLTERAAVEGAKRMATENPGKQYAVMKPFTVLETTKPKVIAKQYNAEGELVLVEGEKKE